MRDAASRESTHEAALEAIGFICRYVKYPILSPHSSIILQAITYGIRTEENGVHVCLAATTALLDSLEFAKVQFDEQLKRDFIIASVCESARSPDSKLSVADLQCLVKMMSLYHQYMEPYMASPLCEIMRAQSGNRSASLHVIQFWIEVLEVKSYTIETYVQNALDYLLPAIGESFETETNDICLMLLLPFIDIHEHPSFIPRVQTHITSTNLRLRDAALMALGNILYRSDINAVELHFRHDVHNLFKSMYENNESYLEPFVKSLVQGLDARVAAKVCRIFSFLAEKACAVAKEYNNGRHDKSFLSPYFQHIALKLVETAKRTEGIEEDVHGAAVKALMDMIENAPKDCSEMAIQITIEMWKRTNDILYETCRQLGDISPFYRN